MSRFVLLSLFFLGWAFYEVSGGTEFTKELQAEKLAALQLEQEQKRTAKADAGAAKVAAVETNLPVMTGAMVTRAAFDPTSVAVPAAKPTQQSTPGETKEQPAADLEPPVPDMRQVRGTRVNLRNGPSTRYNVILKLTRGTRVEILQEPGNGWVKLKVEDTGRVGWMASKLLEKTQG